MNKINTSLTFKTLGVFLTLGIIGVFANTSTVQAAQATVGLGTAEPFAILAGTPDITDSPTSTITGNVGLSPATGAGIGLLCTQVTGTIYAVDSAGDPCFTVNAPLLTGAKNDLTTAYVDAAGRTPATVVPTELGGTTKTAGVYASGSTQFGITAGAGPLVLDGQGDPSSVFIFEAPASLATSLTVGPGSTVSLINGAQACNVFWRVDSAAIDTTAVFKGTILALNSITVANGANIEGRLLARNGNVTLINDTITIPTCAATAGSGATTPGLPNTGVASTGNTKPLLTVGAVIGVACIALVTFLLVRKKRSA